MPANSAAKTPILAISKFIYRTVLLAPYRIVAGIQTISNAGIYRLGDHTGVSGRLVLSPLTNRTSSHNTATIYGNIAGTHITKPAGR